jgi:hypothetical protein
LESESVTEKREGGEGPGEEPGASGSSPECNHDGTINP